MAKKCTRCSSPASVCVCGYTRKAGKRRKRKRAARKAPAGRYWVCKSSTGRTCGVHHRTLSACVAHLRKLRRKDRERRSYTYGHRPRHRQPKLATWNAEPRGFT
jgi:hypothetical protein